MPDRDVALAQSSSAQSRSVSQPGMRSHNLGLILTYVRDHPGCSRTELARVTGLTKPGVTKLVRELIRHRLVAPLGQQESGHRGRPAKTLGLAGQHVVGIGLELRIDHVRAVAVDLLGTSLGEASLLLEPYPKPRSAVRKIGRVVERAMAQAGATAACGMGMAIGSTMDADGKIAIDSAWLGWSDVPIHDMIRAEVGDKCGPLSIESAAALSGLATSRVLAPDQPLSLLHLEVGGGAGLGLVIDGRLSMPLSKGAIGHIPVRRGGVRCGCGNTGCLDTVVGFEALLRALGDHRTRLDEVDQFTYAAAVGKRADDGDRAARRALTMMGREFGRAMAVLLLLVKPDLATVGGYVLGLGPQFLSAVQAEVQRHSYPPGAVPLTIRGTPLGMEGAVIGAAALALEPIFRDPTAAFAGVSA